MVEERHQRKKTSAGEGLGHTTMEKAPRALSSDRNNCASRSNKMKTRRVGSERKAADEVNAKVACAAMIA